MTSSPPGGSHPPPRAVASYTHHHPKAQERPLPVETPPWLIHFTGLLLSWQRCRRCKSGLWDSLSKSHNKPSCWCPYLAITLSRLRICYFLPIICNYLIIYDFKKYHLFQIIYENYKTALSLHLFPKWKVIWVKLSILESNNSTASVTWHHAIFN